MDERAQINRYGLRSSTELHNGVIEDNTLKYTSKYIDPCWMSSVGMEK